MSKFALIKRFLGSSETRERRGKDRRNARPGTRALVIDDSTTIVAVLSKMLRSGGYEVVSALDAEKGLEIARADPPQLIFLDIVLPGMSGFEALRVLRREPATRHVPVILISGNQLATEQFYSYRIGADDFMKKPFPRAEVFARIERLLDADGVPRRIVPAGETDAASAPVAPKPAAETAAPAPLDATAATATPSTPAAVADVPAPAVTAATDAPSSPDAARAATGSSAATLPRTDVPAT